MNLKDMVVTMAVDMVVDTSQKDMVVDMRRKDMVVAMNQKATNLSHMVVDMNQRATNLNHMVVDMSRKDMAVDMKNTKVMVMLNLLSTKVVVDVVVDMVVHLMSLHLLHCLALLVLFSKKDMKHPPQPQHITKL